jgi:hypothetical protein
MSSPNIFGEVELPEELIIAIGAFLLFDRKASIGLRGSIDFVKSNPQALPPTLEDDE